MLAPQPHTVIQAESKLECADLQRAGQRGGGVGDEDQLDLGQHVGATVKRALPAGHGVLQPAGAVAAQHARRDGVPRALVQWVLQRERAAGRGAVGASLPVNFFFSSTPFFSPLPPPV